MRYVRFLLSIFGIFTGGIILGKIAAAVTGHPDILGILAWDTVFVAFAGATAYSAVRK